MVLTQKSFEPIRTSMATVSLGHGFSSNPSLPDKISAIAQAGFKGLELGFPDLVAFASTHHDRSVDATDYDALAAAAEAVKKLCDDAELEIMLLQPFTNFEGWEEDSSERKDAFERANGWIKIMNACECKTLQVGSSDSPEEKIGMDRARFVADLKELADLLAEHELRLAYENWCWSTHAPGWKDAWDIVSAVDKPNVGLCLDTFQTAGSEWADPGTDSGLLEVEETPRELVEEKFKNSLLDLITSVVPEKIYLLQISDAYKPASPITADDDQGKRPKFQWSSTYRPAPFGDGYLPVIDITNAVLQTGFRGWFSYETFDMGPEGKGKDYNLDEFAKETFESHGKLLEECVLKGGGSLDEKDDKEEKKKSPDVNKEEKDAEEEKKQERQDEQQEQENSKKKDSGVPDVNKEGVDAETVKEQQAQEQKAQEQQQSESTSGSKVPEVNKEPVDEDTVKQQEAEEQKQKDEKPKEAMDVNKETQDLTLQEKQEQAEEPSESRREPVYADRE